jgi:c-di-AMP phosphodiesterase-like protein
MQNYTERLTISISGKTYSAMVAFLKKHGADSRDISRFIEDAITWRIMDRELAFHRADHEADVELIRGDGESDARLSA